MNKWAESRQIILKAIWKPAKQDSSTIGKKETVKFYWRALEDLSRNECLWKKILPEIVEGKLKKKIFQTYLGYWPRYSLLKLHGDI